MDLNKKLPIRILCLPFMFSSVKSIAYCFKKLPSFLRVSLCFFSLYTLHFTLVYGAFLDPGCGARPTGMGGAYTALSNDADGIFWNPAGIVRASRMQATFMYAQPFMGLEFYAGESKTNLGMNYGSFIYPLGKYGTMGFGLTNVYVTDIYKESVYALSYAISGSELTNIFKKFQPKKKGFGGFEGFGNKRKGMGQAAGPRAYYGLNLKLLGHKYFPDEYTVADPVFVEGTSKNAISMDLGVLVKRQRFYFGLILKDINQPDVGIKDEDKVPMETRIGMGYNIGRFFPCIDLSFRDKISSYCLGTECSLKPVSLRGGVNMEELTGGFGIAIKLFQLDYSFIWPLSVKGSNGTHRVSITMKFGPEPEEEEEIPAMRKMKPGGNKQIKQKKIKSTKSKTKKIKQGKKKIKKIKQGKKKTIKKKSSKPSSKSKKTIKRKKQYYE